jgi:hypothetical protein
MNKRIRAKVKNRKRKNISVRSLGGKIAAKIINDKNSLNKIGGYDNLSEFVDLVMHIIVTEMGDFENVTIFNDRDIPVA